MKENIYFTSFNLTSDSIYSVVRENTMKILVAPLTQVTNLITLVHELYDCVLYVTPHHQVLQYIPQRFYD